MKVVITERAWSDLLDIGRSVQQDNPNSAERLIEKLYERCEGLARMPRAYPLLPTREESGVRRRPCGNYLIFYRLSDSRVEVLRILHGARDYDRILFPDE